MSPQPRHITGARLGSGPPLGQGFSGAQIGCRGATSLGCPKRRDLGSPGGHALQLSHPAHDEGSRRCECDRPRRRDPQTRVRSPPIHRPLEGIGRLLETRHEPLFDAFPIEIGDRLFGRFTSERAEGALRGVIGRDVAHRTSSTTFFTAEASPNRLSLALHYAKSFGEGGQEWLVSQHRGELFARVKQARPHREHRRTDDGRDIGSESPSTSCSTKTVRFFSASFSITRRKARIRSDAPSLRREGGADRLRCPRPAGPPFAAGCARRGGASGPR